MAKALKFSARTAAKLAEICDWIYGDETWTPTTHVPLAEVEFVDFFPDKRVITLASGRVDLRTSYAAVVLWDGFAVVAYQGTQFKNVLDWLRDLDAAMVPFRLSLPGGGLTLPARVHAGFLSELDEVQDDVVACLRTNARVRGKPILITGHSQGGGEAYLANASLVAAGFDVAATYTFEAPRAGGEALGKLLRPPIFRFEFGRDIVPHVPPDARLVDDPGRLVAAIVAAMEELAGKLGGTERTALSTIADVIRSTQSSFDSILGPLGGLLGTPLGTHAHLSVPKAIRTALGHLIERVGDDLKPLLFLLYRLTGPLEYRAFGTLIYVPGPGDAAVVAPKSEVETNLFYDRLSRLASAGKRAFDDHHIATWKSELDRIL